MMIVYSKKDNYARRLCYEIIMKYKNDEITRLESCLDWGVTAKLVDCAP